MNRTSFKSHWFGENEGGGVSEPILTSHNKPENPQTSSAVSPVALVHTVNGLLMNKILNTAELANCSDTLRVISHVEWNTSESSTFYEIQIFSH